MPFDQIIFAEVRAAVRRDMYHSQVAVSEKLQQAQRVQEQKPQAKTNSQRTSQRDRARAPELA